MDAVDEIKALAAARARVRHLDELDLDVERALSILNLSWDDPDTGEQLLEVTRLKDAIDQARAVVMPRFVDALVKTSPSIRAEIEVFAHEPTRVTAPS